MGGDLREGGDDDKLSQGVTWEVKGKRKLLTA